MSPPRRRALAAGALALLACGCAPIHTLVGEPRRRAAWPRAETAADWRLLSRATFGPHPLERARLAAIGRGAWVEEQLAPEQIDDTELQVRLGPLESLAADISTIYEWGEEQAAEDLQRAALLRAVYSRRQLYEVLVDFWSDHFSIALSKPGCGWLKPIDDREAIRPHALGHFSDLLRASLHSPAMLVYLDNAQNRAGSPNENYARELLELHTLGADTGYTQRDIQEVARCLTGWGVGEGPLRGTQQFDAGAHDDQAKWALGAAIAAGGGARDPERVVELLLAHPATPRRVVGKLAQRLIGPGAPPALLAAAEQTFRRTQGDIRATVRELLLSPAMAAAPPRLKRPLSLVAGAIRQLDGETDAGPALLDLLGRMGQPLFGWATPDGFPERDSAWGGATLMRWQFALRLAHGQIPGTTIDLPRLLERSGAADTPEAVDRLGALLLGAPLREPQRAAVIAAVGPRLDELAARQATAIILAGPDYQWR